MCNTHIQEHTLHSQETWACEDLCLYSMCSIQAFKALLEGVCIRRG